MKLKFLNILFVCLILCLPDLNAASFIPATTNYTVDSYNAGHQNWSCTQGPNGVMYFGNNNGLLTFDGFFWNLYSVPGNFAVRSVFVDGDRIYIGSFEEFGYFRKNDRGELDYVSLSDSIKEKVNSNDEIWNIVRINKKIFFQSFTGIYVYDGERVEPGKLPVPIRPLFCSVINGMGYIQAIDGDFYSFDGENMKMLFSREQLKDDVVSILPFKGDEFILFSLNNGLFRYSNGTVSRFATDIDTQLIQARGNRSTILKDSVIVLGTISNGLYGIDYNGKLLWHLNRENQLNNNTIMGICRDKDGNLWTALDDGISFLRTNTLTTLLIPSSKDYKFGMVYGVEKVGTKMFMATNQGAYVYDMNGGGMELLPYTQGQNWYVKKIDRQLFIGNNSATLCYDGKVSQVKGTSSSTCIKKASINGTEVLVEASYAELRIWKKNSDGYWFLSHNVNDFLAPVKSLEIDESGVIWASHMYSGLYKIKLTDDLCNIKEIDRIYNLDKSEHNSSNKINVFKIRGKVVFSDEEGYFVYDESKQKIVPYGLLKNSDVIIKNAHCAVDTHYDDMIWLVNDDEYVLLQYNKGKFYVKKRILSRSFDSPCIEGYANVYVEDDVSYLNLNNCVARIFPLKDSVDKKEYVKAEFSKIIAESSDGMTDILNLASENTLDSKFRDLKVYVSYPSYKQGSLRFKFIMDGEIDITEEGDMPHMHFASLEYGKYSLDVEVLNEEGKLLDTVSYSFIIDRPVWMSNWMIVVYILVAGAVLFLFVRWREKAVEKKKKKEFETHRIEQNIQISEQQRLIAEQQKQLLENELTLKGKELASMTLARLAKQETLESLRKFVQEQLLKNQCGRKNMEMVLKQINDNIDNEDFWTVFENNFDLIHQRFFRTLKERYPGLTATDLRFCALLRLNMSTKDIAQMTNLTIRGVEAARYRIRKRIGVPDGVSLVDFFIEFK